MSTSVVLLLSLATISAEGRRTAVVEVVERAGPAVVSIGAETVSQNPFRRGSERDEAWRQFFGGPRERERAESSLGSGVIIRSDGIILTNEHVVSRANSITVTLRDRRTFEADVVGADPAFDIAVLKLRNARDLPTVTLGTSSDLMPGETVVAIGNPFGLSNTVTTGVVSALHRSVPMPDRAYEDFIQTDAAINPGNSGGALLNIEGALIGINTAIYGQGNGIGFAIPIDKAKAVVEEVVRYGEVRPASLGFTLERRGGAGPARVASLDADGPAQAAGVKVGDVLVDVGGQQISDEREFRQRQRALVPGQRVKLSLLRGGQPVTVEVQVRELTAARAAQLGRERLGIQVAETRDGVLVITGTRAGTDAARIGLRKGDVLLSVAGRVVRTVAELDQLCAAIRDAEATSVIIGRDRRRYYVTLELR